ncbi:hypothetical protein [uncultured Brevundimonas sp.]|uniref:hypothetical protein n=1 Tax=uncultured Brevundimonas sp. TaxID=213418 RepID=UPI0026174F0D|nr:hypothetical protein [uncultured Brevundimonas sp.]
MTAAHADASDLDRKPGTRFKKRLMGAANVLMSKTPDAGNAERAPAKAKSSALLSPSQVATRHYSVKGMKLSLVRNDIYRRAVRGKNG